MARRARRAGLRVLVDLHYSDFWADPGKQWTPAAWEGKSFPELKATFTAYTRGIVRSLAAQGTPPDMVQIGNEINPGMLWDYARHVDGLLDRGRRRGRSARGLPHGASGTSSPSC